MHVRRRDCAGSARVGAGCGRCVDRGSNCFGPPSTAALSSHCCCRINHRARARSPDERSDIRGSRSKIERFTRISLRSSGLRSALRVSLREPLGYRRVAGVAPEQFGAKRLKNYHDGGEAILEAFRNLGIDYIISSPGSEWASVWEALARQKTGNQPGPTYFDVWHESTAVDMAIGYTQMTGRMQAVLLHAGPGLLQGSMAVQAAQQTEVPMLVMSGEALSFGEDPNFEPGQQWYRSLSVVGGPQRLIEPVVKHATAITSPWSLYETVVRVGELAQRQPYGPVYINVPVEHMVHEWVQPVQTRRVPPAPKAQPMAGRYRCAGRTSRARKKSRDRDPIRGQGPGNAGAARRTRRASRRARGRGLIDDPCELSERSSAAPGHELRADREGRRRRAAGRLAQSLVSAAQPPARRFHRGDRRNAHQGTLGLPASSCRHVSRSGHRHDVDASRRSIKGARRRAEHGAPRQMGGRARKEASCIACRRGGADEPCGRSTHWR